MKILAIDPGNIETGWCLVDSKTYKPEAFGKWLNEQLETLITTTDGVDHFVIEEIRNYGSLMGQSVLDTCVQIGRFQKCIEQHYTELMDEDAKSRWSSVPRKTYITDLTNDPKSKDANIIQYLIDRFAQNTTNRGKGTKKKPGWFYGFYKDVWQAYAIAVWYCDKINNEVF